MTQAEWATELDKLAAHHQGIAEVFAKSAEQKDKSAYHAGLSAGYANAAGFVREIAPAPK
jgi:hypothetical protein